MDQSPESEVEADVIARLQQFQPRPSQRAYQRVTESAPWLQTNEPERKTILFILSHSRPLRATAAVILCVFVAGVVIWSTPTLRSLAQDIIDSLFNRLASDTYEVELVHITVGANTLPPSVTQGFISVQQAEAATGVKFRQPGIDLDPYMLTGAIVYHETETLWLVYNAPGRLLNIYQRDAELGWLGEGFVGASAEVTTVQFENASGETITGEYVVGGWLPTEEVTAAEGETYIQPLEWSAATSQRRLRWQDSDRVYEMTAYGGSGDTPDRDLMLDDMIAIAASMG